MKTRILLLLASLGGWNLTLMAQPGPASVQPFGQVANEWIGWEAGPDYAPQGYAVIFHQGTAGFLYYSREPVMTWTEHRRVKVFTQDAAEALRQVSFTYETDQEYVTEIKAATYSLNARGGVVQFKVPGRQQSRRRLPDGRTEISFEYPFIRAGAVVELIITRHMRSYAELPRWQFQEAAPVLLSQYEAFIPDVLVYSPQLTGNASLVQIQSRPFIRFRDLGTTLATDGLNARQIDALGRSGVTNAGTQVVYTAQQMPPIPQEAFASDAALFVPALTMRLEEDRLGSRYNSQLFDSWNALNRAMLRRLALPKSNEARIGELVRTLASGQDQPRDRAAAIFRGVCDRFAWNQQYGLHTGNLNDLFETGSGSGSELNLLLLSLLQEAGLEAAPVLLSTRSNGPAHQELPTVSQFNHLIVSLLIDDEEILLDASGGKTALGILPEEDLNFSGFRLSPGGGAWTRLQSRNYRVRYTYSRFDLAGDGQLQGEISVIYESYGAAVERNKLSQLLGSSGSGSGAVLEQYFRREVAAGIEGAEILDRQVDNPDDPELPVRLSMRLQTRDFVSPLNDLMVIRPMLNRGISENPLKEENRLSPLDLDHPLRESHMLGLRIPPGYELAQTPQPVRVVLPGNSAVFMYNVIPSGNIVHISSSIYINQTVFYPYEYPAIRQFFDLIVSKHQEDLVIRRIPGPGY